MKTVIKLSRQGTDTTNTFYYINIYTQSESGGLIYAYSSFLISQAQYYVLKGQLDEYYENNFYWVNLA